MLKAEGVGIHDDYKKNAHKQCDILFRVKVKGRSILVDDIPLHMSLKCFNSKNEFTIDEVKMLVKKLDIRKPDLKGVELKPIIFTNEKTQNKYFMLILEGIDEKFKKFCDAFKDVGITHKKFMGHITIDKDLYDDIKKNGITTDELEFGPLMIEHGAGNDIHTFAKSEDLQKGPIKNTLAALGVAGSMAAASAPRNSANAMTAPKQEVAQRSPAAAAPKQNAYDHKRMLNTISSVESHNGKYQKHKPLPENGIHRGERAFGKYGLTPVIVRETVHMHPELQQKHKKLMALRGDDLHRYMQDNPGLEDVIADKHLQRLEHHFGQDPKSIGYAWLEGIKGTYQARKENKDIANHWHVRKINDAYSQGQ